MRSKESSATPCAPAGEHTLPTERAGETKVYGLPGTGNSPPAAGDPVAVCKWPVCRWPDRGAPSRSSNRCRAAAMPDLTFSSTPSSSSICEMTLMPAGACWAQPFSLLPAPTRTHPSAVQNYYTSVLASWVD